MRAERSERGCALVGAGPCGLGPVRGEGKRLGRAGPCGKERRGAAWAVRGLGLKGWFWVGSGFFFSFSILIQTQAKRIQINLNSNSNQSTKEKMLQHECNNKV